jgi:hypothetical protein
MQLRIKYPEQLIWISQNKLFLICKKKKSGFVVDELLNLQGNLENLVLELGNIEEEMKN